MINALLARLVRPEPGQGATSAVLKIAEPAGRDAYAGNALRNEQ